MPLLEKIVFLVMVLHLVACPFTKVEESFNLQAIHDVLYHGLNITQYDHLEFSGVVPRTFLGPLLVGGMAAPFVRAGNLLGATKFLSQYIVRTMLGVLVLLSLWKYKRAVGQKLGQGVGKWLLVLTASQFHVMFYMTRPLPNTFALFLALLTLTWWLNKDLGKFIWSAACGILVFRSELAILFGLMLLAELWSRRLGLGRLILHAVPAGIFWLGLSALVDSFFWRRWLWPEGEVLWFNVVLNKSAEWGTSPGLWYLYSVLPRALGASLLLVPVGMYLDGRALALTLPALGFVSVYSLLPHKELRFIVYVFPMLNTAAATACNRLWINRRKSMLRGLLAAAAVGHLAVNLATTCALLHISMHNYPGGVAMQRLHEIESSNSDVHVHIDIATAQTGVSRFSQLHDNWRYNKTEDLLEGGPEMMDYSHIFIGTPDGSDEPIQPYKHTHDILTVVDGFDKLHFQGREFPPVMFSTRPKIYLLKKKVP